MDRDRSAKRYHRIQLGLGGVSLAVSAAWLVVLVVIGGGRALVDVAARWWHAWPWELLVVAAGVVLGKTLLTLPIRWVRGYWLPRRFGLLHQTLPSWLLDAVKAAALGGILSLVVLEAIYALLRATAVWWLGAAAFIALVSLLIGVIAPVVIVPLFYRLTPLTDETLRERLLALARRVGVPAIGVFVVDQSRKSRTANAALTGFGRTRRIILFDTLIAAFTPDEIESVLAHELGHHVHHDMWRGLAAQTAIGLVTFWVAARVLAATAGAVGLGSVADPAGLPWLVLVLGALGVLAVPIANAVSRAMERAADDFALATTGNATAFIDAMQRLGDLNLAEKDPPRVKEILLYSHPSVARRIARAAGAKA